jgi:hypothetical protein
MNACEHVRSASGRSGGLADYSAPPAMMDSNETAAHIADPSQQWCNRMKAFLDANVFDWLAEPANGARVRRAIAAGTLRAMTGPEVAFEIRRTPDVLKRAALEEVLALTFPLVPTRLPRSGLARSGLAICAGSKVEALHEKLKAIPGVDRLDPVHLLNGTAERCDLFVTFDKRLLSKREALCAILSMEVISPTELELLLTSTP